MGRWLAGLLVGLAISLPAHVHPQLNGEQKRELEQWQEFQRQKSDAPEDPANWKTSYWDPGQNVKLDQVDDHLKSVDAEAKDLRDKHDALANQVAGLSARSDVWFALLSAAAVAALGLAAKNFLSLREKP